MSFSVYLVVFWKMYTAYDIKLWKIKIATIFKWYKIGSKRSIQHTYFGFEDNTSRGNWDMINYVKTHPDEKLRGFGHTFTETILIFYQG